MSVLIGAPDLKFQGKLVWPFSEDEATAAYELVRQAEIPTGSGVTVRGVQLPAWWWTATGLEEQEKADWHIVALDGEHGVAIVVTDEDLSMVEGTLIRALSQARELPVDEAARLRKARDPAPRDADFPLGAHVIQPRHEEVLLERMDLSQGAVVTWTRVAPGAGPSEFARMQEACGAYTVVMVQCGDERTVGLWFDADEPTPGTPVAPVLRRLFLREGVWRYGMGFAPTL